MNNCISFIRDVKIVRRCGKSMTISPLIHNDDTICGPVGREEQGGKERLTGLVFVFEVLMIYCPDNGKRNSTKKGHDTFFSFVQFLMEYKS